MKWADLFIHIALSATIFLAAVLLVQIVWDVPLPVRDEARLVMQLESVDDLMSACGDGLVKEGVLDAGGTGYVECADGRLFVLGDRWVWRNNRFEERLGVPLEGEKP